MKKQIALTIAVLFLGLLLYGPVLAFEGNVNLYTKYESRLSEQNEMYGVQWEMNYGSDDWYGARYEGPQPIGDCDNDGDNELLIGGRDAVLRVMEWDEEEQTYEETHSLRCPFYPLRRLDADGFAIGDLTGDGENEIAVSWYATVHKWNGQRYRIIGWNPWIEWNGGGNPDCYIGDCDNDGQNELIMSCRDWTRSVPEIVVFKWNGWALVKVSEWDDPGINGEVFMAGMGDPDNDGENEIILGSGNKVVVLNWNKQTEEFEPTIVISQPGQGWENHPFACVSKDSDMDGIDEIHVGYFSPRITIFEWDGDRYEIKYDKFWPDEGVLIEALDVGDVDDDGINEVCAGTDVIHILQWNGTDYEEEALIDETFGDLAVLNIGDIDNDGKNEIHAGSVIVEPGEDFMAWIFKYGWT
ncbi:MAG: hypothetical protein ACTSSH_06600 [Candidatus Heimdallarchaeota archaeon]